MIGNYFEYKCHIIKFAIEDFSEVYNNSPFLDLLDPIFLTDEWMLKFGFKKVGINYEKDWLLLLKNKSTNTLDFIISGNRSYNMNITNLKYVHELQNLFFAITKTELKLENKNKNMKPFLISHIMCNKNKCYTTKRPQYTLVYAKTKENAIKKITKKLGNPLYNSKWLINDETLI